MGYWKNHARAVILDVMKTALADGLDRANLIKRIDAAYPFGERKNYPYQAWLEVKRSLLFDGQPTPTKFHYQPPSEAAKLRAAGERGLFDGDSTDEN
jgi:hypothetical protein